MPYEPAERIFLSIALSYSCAARRICPSLCFELQAEAESVDKVISDLSVQDELNVDAFVGEFDTLSKKHEEIPADDFNNDDVYRKSLDEVLSHTQIISAALLNRSFSQAITCKTNILFKQDAMLQML